MRGAFCSSAFGTIQKQVQPNEMKNSPQDKLLLQDDNKVKPV